MQVKRNPRMNTVLTKAFELTNLKRIFTPLSSHFGGNFLILVVQHLYKPACEGLSFAIILFSSLTGAAYVKNTQFHLKFLQ